MILLFLQLFFCSLRFKKKRTLSLTLTLFLPVTALADRSAIVDVVEAGSEYGDRSPIESSHSPGISHGFSESARRSLRLMKGTFAKAGSIKPVQGELLSVSLYSKFVD